MTGQFVQYVGPADLHDATVVAFEHHGDVARVTVASYEGRRFTLEFSGVTAVESVRPIGMLLYALAEVTTLPPGRRFEFAASDDESDARLGVTATTFVVADAG